MKIRNVSLILTGLSIVGTAVTAILASKATLDAQDTIEHERGMRFDLDEPTDFTKKELVKIAWKHYIPAGIAGAATAGCMIASHKMTYKHILALSSAGVLSGRLLDEYKYKAEKLIGKEKLNEIKRAVWKDSKASPVDADEGNDPEVYFYEEYNDRYFKSSLLAVQAAETALNRSYVEHNDATLGKFYDILGIPDPTGIADRIGWAHEIHTNLWIDITHEKLDEFTNPATGEPMKEDCYLLSYEQTPEPLDRLE